MIFAGERQIGKTHRAISEIALKCKNGETVGIITYNDNYSYMLKKVVESTLKFLHKDGVKVKIIKLEDRNTVDYAFIDELDLLLGKNCICTTGGIINLIGKSPYNYNDNYTYKEETVNKQGGNMRYLVYDKDTRKKLFLGTYEEYKKIQRARHKESFFILDSIYGTDDFPSLFKKLEKTRDNISGINCNYAVVVKEPTELNGLKSYNFTIVVDVEKNSFVITCPFVDGDKIVYYNTLDKIEDILKDIRNFGYKCIVGV